MRVTVLLAADPPKTILDTGRSVVLLDAAESVRLPAEVSISPTVKAMAEVAVPEVVVWFEIDEAVGRSLTELTVKVKLVEAVSAPASVTVRVTVEVPD